MEEEEVDEGDGELGGGGGGERELKGEEEEVEEKKANRTGRIDNVEQKELPRPTVLVPDHGQR